MHPPRQRTVLNLIQVVSSLMFFSLCALSALGQTSSANQIQELLPNQTFEKDLTGTETHRYKFDLKANEFFQVRVEQKGVDVALKLIDASGKVLATMDSPNGKQGPETLSFIAEKSAAFALEVSALDTKAEKRSYSISREASRASTPKDQRRVEVEKLFVEGLAARETTGQRDLAIKKLTEALAGWEELEDNPLKELTSQQLNQLVQVPPEINAILEDIKRDLQNAQSLLMGGQELMVKSNADSLPAREKLTKALKLFRSVNAKVSDSFDRVSQSGETARQSLNVLKIFEFYAKSGEALTFQGVAQTHANLGERQESIDSTKQAVGVYEEVFSDKTLSNISGLHLKETISTLRFNYAAALGSIGHDLDQYLGKSKEGLTYLTRAVERYRSLYQETQDPKVKLLEARTLAFIGGIYGRDSKSNDRAIEFLTKALEVFQSLPNQEEEAAGALSMIATRQSLNYAFKDALENWAKALAIYRKVDYRHGESNILRQIGLMYWVLNNKAKVLEYTNQNLASLQAPDFAENWKKRLNTKASGIYDELYGALIDHTRLDNIAFVYRIREDYQKSLEYYEKALVVAPSLKDPRTVRSSFRSVAYSFAKLEQWDKACQSYKQALEISRKHGAREDISDDLQDVGWALLEAGKPHEALPYQNESLSIIQSVGVDETKAFSVSFSNLLNELARSYSALGNHRLAIFYAKRAVNAIQGERQKLQALDLVSQKGFLEKKAKHYRRLADWLIAAGRLPEAEQVLRMLKEDEYFRFIRRDASEVEKLSQRADLRPDETSALKRYNEISGRLTALGEAYAKLETKRTSPPAGATWSPPEKEQHARLAKDIEDANNVFQVFLRELADEFAKTPKATKVMEDSQQNAGLGADLKRWRSELGVKGVVTLYTVLGEDRYRVILTTPDVQTDGKTEIKAEALRAKIARFRQAVTDPKIDPRPLGKELYDIIVKPVEKHLAGANATTILWSLDDTLRYLPLAALWDGEHYFGEKYQNVVITLASRTRLGDKPSADWDALGLGVSETRQVSVPEPEGTTRSMNFVALPGVLRELQSIVRDETSGSRETGILPGKRLLDATFTEAALKDSLGGRYKVVHIASHFSFRPGDLTRSFLLLGDGAALTVNSFKTSPQLAFTGVELLTLSACDTAIGEANADGVEIESFGVIAQNTGAQAVLATLWRVADESTQLLMSEFYRLHKANPRLTKAAALQLAQQRMIEGKLQPRLLSTGAISPGPKQVRSSERVATEGTMGAVGQTTSFPYDPKTPYAHPYYWASFILIGNWK